MNDTLREMSEVGWTRRRRLGAVIAGVVILGMIAGVWWWRHRPPEGFIVEVQAVDDGSALVVWRLNPEDGASREWIAHFDGGGALDWRHELSGLTSVRAMFVIGDLVTVRYSHQDHGAVDEAVAAYALGDGHLVWDDVLSSIAQTPGAHIAPISIVPAFSAGGKLVEHVIELGDHVAHVLYAIDPSSGQILGHAPVDASPEPVGPLVVGDRLVLHGSGPEVNVIDTSHGVAVTNLHVGGGGLRIGCVIGDDYITVVSADDKVEDALVAFHHGDPASRRVLAQPFHPVEGESLSFRNCGHYRDRMVFAIVESPFTRRHSTTSIAIADPNGTVLATVAMAFSSTWLGGALSTPPDSLAFSGALPRFVPYLSMDDAKEHDLDQHLAMVDLEQARIAWVASKPLASSDETFRTGDRWYLNNSISGGDVVAFDGTTGQLVAAIHGGKALEPWHVAGGKLWLHSEEWGRLDKAPLAALDAKTLAPLFARGIEITDVTRQVRDKLGIP